MDSDSIVHMNAVWYGGSGIGYRREPGSDTDGILISCLPVEIPVFLTCMGGKSTYL